MPTPAPAGTPARWLVSWQAATVIVTGDLDAAWTRAADMIARSGVAPGPVTGYPRVTAAPAAPADAAPASAPPDSERRAIVAEPVYQAPDADAYPPGLYYCAGDTYPARESIRRAGFRWAGARWSGSEIAARTLVTLGLPAGVTIERDQPGTPAAPAARPVVAVAPAVAPVPPSSPASSPVPPSSRPASSPVAAPVRGITVDAAGAERATTNHDAMVAAGWARPRPHYAIGTMVIDAGVSNARASREAFETLPESRDAFARLEAAVVAEARDSAVVRTRDLRLAPDGTLTRGRGSLRLVEASFPGLCSRAGLPAGAGSYLGACPPDLRASNFNHWTEQAPADATMVLRHRRDASGGREVFAVVSERYAAVDADAIARALTAAAPEGSRARVEYDGRRLLVDVELHSPVEAESYVAGETYRAGIRISSDDTGGGSLRGSSYVITNLCLNLMILDRQDKPAFQLRHIGDPVRLAREMRAGLARAAESIRYVAEAWNTARRENLLEQIKAWQPAAAPTFEAPADSPFGPQAYLLHEGILRALADREALPLARRAIPQVMARLREDVNQAPALSRGRLVNGITSYATRDVADPWTREGLERAAGALVIPGRDGRLPILPWAAE